MSAIQMMASPWRFFRKSVPVLASVVVAAPAGPLALVGILPMFVSTKEMIQGIRGTASEKGGIVCSFGFMAVTLGLVTMAHALISEPVLKAQSKATLLAVQQISSDRKESGACENYVRGAYLGWGEVRGTFCARVTYAGHIDDIIYARTARGNLIAYNPSRPAEYRTGAIVCTSTSDDTLCP